MIPKDATGSALELARRVLAIEADAVRALIARLDERFLAAVSLILACKGRVIVSGIGKSGHIARKIASTLSSTGTPAHFVHPAEASHGDLGMIQRDDVFIALSNSGESAELVEILPPVKRLGAKLITITGNAKSTLAREADVNLDAAVAEEACPHNLAPTASTTAALALGDALAVALLDARGFSAADFHQHHPRGQLPHQALAHQALLHVTDVMRSGADVPKVAEGAMLKEAIAEMTRGRIGMTAVLDKGGRVCGVFTDGDLRRSLQKDTDVSTARVSDVMSRGPRSIRPEALAAEAVQIMEAHKVNQLLVVDARGELVGALNMHDLFRAKVIYVSDQSRDAAERAKRVRLMLFDVDGVLTDGRLWYGPAGESLQAFHVLDGHGVKLLAIAGIQVGLLSGRSSAPARARATELGIAHVLQGIDDKKAAFEALAARLGVAAAETGFMGDEVVDLPVLRRCGFACAPAQAHELVRANVHFVTRAPGGGGAVREACEFVLRAQGRLDTAFASYLA